MNKRGLIGWVGGAVTLVAAVVGISIGGAVGREVGGVVSQSVTGERPTEVRDSPWESRSIAGLWIAAPEAFDPHQMPIPPDLERSFRENVAFSEFARSDAGPVNVMVTHIVYKAHVPVSLDGAARGAMERPAALAGMQDFQFSNVEAVVSGRPAIRGSARFELDNSKGRVETLTVVDGQDMWQVQTLFADSPVASAIADRLLESIRVRS